MIKNIYCHKLKLDIPPLKNFNIKNITQTHVSINLEEINPEIKEWLDSLGISVTWIEVFYRRPGNYGGIHSDGDKGDCAKINWIYGGKGSGMNWYQVIDSKALSRKSNFTVVNTGYIPYSVNEVKEVYSAKLTGPYLLQVGIPHSVFNPHEERYCLCFLLKDKHGNHLPMSTAYNILSNYII